MSKVSIIGGAGTLGAAVAYTLASNQNIKEMCLIDINENLLLNHLMDFQNAFPSKIMYKGSYEDLKGTDVVVITAGIPNRNDISSRNVFLEGNLHLFKNFGKEIKKHCPNALIVTASNPVDVLNYYLHVEYQFEIRQLIGYTINDSLRFEWALRNILDLNDKEDIFCPVIGEHGSSQVPLFSQVKLNGEAINLSTEQKDKVLEKLQSWFIDFNRLNINRTTGWTTAKGMGMLIDKLIKEEVSDFIGSSILTGNYGISDVSLGVPLTVNREGIQSVVEWSLAVEEKEKLVKSANLVAGLIKEYILKERV